MVNLDDVSQLSVARTKNENKANMFTNVKRKLRLVILRESC